MVQDVKAAPSSKVPHTGSKTKAAPVGKGSAGSKTGSTPSKSIFPGRIVTPPRAGKLRDGATSRIKGNRMKSRGWGKKR
jgi:hypothetical protein